MPPALNSLTSTRGNRPQLALATTSFASFIASIKTGKFDTSWP
ncbi:hypothetical protein NKH77_15985 [Streptomyces sp. M19]